MKKVLVVYYSQSGQLLEIAQNVSDALGNDEAVDLNFYEIKLQTPFAFPWKKPDFFNAFPESFNQTPAPLVDLDNELLKEKYDLIIMAYQVWFLSPSIPTTSFIKSQQNTNLFTDTPVLTLIGCRNMWYKAQEKTLKLLQQVNAKTVGNIVLVDKHINHISVITIVQWMFSGVKKKYLGVFPLPGVAQNDIDSAKRFGKTILNAVKTNSFCNFQFDLVKQGAVPVKSFLVLVDKRATVLFSKWANFISSKGQNIDDRRFRLKLFNYYLLIAIWVLSPIVMLFFFLSYPLRYKQIQREINIIKHTTQIND